MTISALDAETRPQRPRRERPGGGKRRMWTFHNSRDLFSSIFNHKPNHPLTTYSYPTESRMYDEDRAERKAAKRRERREDKHKRDEFSDDSEDEYAAREPKMLEAPSTTAGASAAGSEADFIRERERRREREGEREREPQYMSGGLGRRGEEGR